eukprot:CAMPEP_0170251196 /NCGR_PEP_ID=MMETSP0116_2-20130129/25427_1 /TAXON_ID=400756 /ORGANISM="Durinskia baltica, Strain CSIRO CS-38" /LENGTH=45 /DNA_ID= /DNA_START= /DNA_END= /DNA_ORIENTATION=
MSKAASPTAAAEQSARTSDAKTACCPVRTGPPAAAESCERLRRQR